MLYTLTMAFNFSSPINQQPTSSFGYGQPLGTASQSNFFGQSSQQAAPIQSTGYQFGQASSGNAFGQTSTPGFGQISTNTFGQPTTPSLSFGQPQSSPFGQPTQTTSTFGQLPQTSSIFGQTSTTPGFGQIQPASTFGQSSTQPLTFGQPQASTFGQPTQTSNAFGQLSQTSSIFGQATQPLTFGQPATTSLFGSTTTQPQTTSFSFGQPTQTVQPQTTSLFSFGQSTFGQPLQTQPLQQTSAFGQLPSSTFGQSSTQPLTFGQPQTTAFGQPVQTTNAFGQLPQTSIFGQTSTPGFGQIPPTSTFGQSSTPSLTFGQPQISAFGQPVQTASAFGQLPQTSSIFGQATQPLTFGQPATTSIFGSTNTQPLTTSFSFGQPTQAVQPTTSFSFGQPATSAPTFNFNPPAATTNSFSFGQPPATAPTFSFGGSAFGTAPKPATSFSFGQSTFGQPLQTQQQSTLFGQPQPLQQPQLLQQQQQQPQQVEESHAFYQSIFQCNKFGDERDAVLANFNYLQACWGTGKGHYSQTFPPVTYTSSNPFYRFKAVGYSFIFANNNEDGHVAFKIRKNAEKIRAEETQFITNLQAILNRPNILFKVSGIKETEEEDTTIVNVFAEDRMSLRRIPATDLWNAFSPPQYKPQLEVMGVADIDPKIKPSPEQLKRYLENAPEGMDPRVWRQANLDNPDPANMIPVPVIGVDALKKRLLRQETESQQHMARLTLIGEEVASLQSRHPNVTSELQQMRRKQAQLSHRLLSVIVRQEMMRKQGMTFQVDEELLGNRLQAIHDRLNSPTELKGRLSELLPQIRLHNFSSGGTRYTIDDANLAQIKEFLSIEQRSMKELVDTVRGDLDQLKLISDRMAEMSSKLN